MEEATGVEAYPGSNIDSSMVTGEEGKKNFVVSLSSDKEMAELATFYEEALQGNGIAPEKMEIKDETSNTVILSGKTDTLDVSVQIYDGESIGNEGNVVNFIVTKVE